MENEQMMQEAPEEAGRGTDTVMAHMSLGEVVIPREFLSDPDVMGMLEALFQQNGSSLNEFTVGDPTNKINPETGYPEFGFFKSLGKIFKVAAPLALSYFAPGVGTAVGSALGAGSTFAPIVGGAAIGAGTSAITGGKPLQGAVLGGVGSAVSSAANGGFNDTVLGRGISDVASGVSDVFGTRADSVTLPGIGKTSLNNGTGILGAIDSVRSAAPSIGGISGGATGGGSTFSPLGIAANIFGGLNQEAALKKQQKQLLGANQQQQANLESFDPSGITSDPGYQFNLEQGQKGIDRALAASGSTASGRAIKAATEYNQNYANNAFKDYYARWLQKTQGQNQLIGASGDIQANKTGASSQNLSQSLSNILGSPVGQYGQGITLEQLRRLGLA